MPMKATVNDTTDALANLRSQSNFESNDRSRAIPILTESELFSDKYKMDYPRKGTALIINNLSFNETLRKAKRSGSNHDESCMYDLLSMLGFEDIITKANRTCAQMKEDLNEVARKDHSSNSCFVCVILSYGEDGSVYGVDSDISIDDLFEPFKGHRCPTLAGKPKMFIVQACSAKQPQFREEADACGMEVEIEELMHTKIPTEADFLTVYSEVPGKFGWDSKEKKSWFIQSLFDAFKEVGLEKDVLTIMTRVLRKVDQQLESLRSHNKSFQIPCITSMLTKNWYFK